MGASSWFVAPDLPFFLYDAKASSGLSNRKGTSRLLRWSLFIPR